MDFVGCPFIILLIDKLFSFGSSEINLTFSSSERSSPLELSRFVNTSKPLFPGYMFIKFDRAESVWHKINSTYGVSRLITFNSILKSIPTTIVDSLMMRYDLSGKLIPIQKLKKGDQVTVLKGPFANFIATVEKHEADRRIWILMDLSLIHI